MLRNRAVKARIRKGLIFTCSILGLAWIALIIYGLCYIKPKELGKAKERGQHYEFASSSLPSMPSNLMLGNNIPNLDSDNNDIYVPDDIPKIAILLTNLGLNQNSTELAISLPKEISLGFLPYTNSLRPLFTKAQELEHELFIYLPFETQNYPIDFPGHMPILKALSNEENIKRLNALLNMFEGYIGVYGSYKEVFTEDSIKSTPIFDELNQRNLTLFLGHDFGKEQFKGEKNVQALSADIILDLEPNVGAIKENLDKLIEIAEAKKTAVAYADSYPVTIYTLKAWLPMLKSKNIKLVPVSHILKDQRYRERNEESK